MPAAILVAFIALVALGSVAWAGRADRPARPGAPAPVALTVTGDVDGVHPGAPATLTVRIRNPHPFAVRVDTFDVTIASASSSCSADVLRIETAHVRGRTLGARTTSSIDVAVAVSQNAPDACQGARWPLTYSVVATKSR